MVNKKVTTIPATISKFNLTPINEVKKRRVAGYARVSTDSEEQQTSYEAQVDYYTNYIKSKEDWEFVQVYTDPGYEIPVPVGRYDIFYNGPDAYQFCELNTDGSSAMNEDRVLGGILEHTQIFDTMAEEWRWRRFELFDSLVNAFLARYESIRGSRAKVVAIVDLLDKGTTVEFEVFRQAFARAGVRALICDVRRLTFDGTHLIGVDPETGEKLPIDLVYRRLVTSDFVAMRKEAEAFEAAYRAQAFVSFGSFRSQVMHAKTIFSMLHAPETKRILSAAENAFIAAHVPWTKELIDAEDQARIIDEKDRYILKPYNSYSSQGVLLGREHSAKEWADIVRGLPFDRYIYQEYVDVDRTPFVVPDGKGGMAIEHLGHVIGLFLYDEKFAGIYTRVGREGIISGARTYYTAPAFVVERRRAHE